MDVRDVIYAIEHSASQAGLKQFGLHSTGSLDSVPLHAAGYCRPSLALMLIPAWTESLDLARLGSLHSARRSLHGCFCSSRLCCDGPAV